MSGVVLRCPNCGTTRAAPGECEGCHEAQVRYYCTTHTPGRWLDTPSCPECGARFGEAMSHPVRPGPTTPTRRTVRPAPGVPARTPAPPSPPRGPTDGERTSGSPDRTPYDEFDAREEYAPRGASLHDLLLAAARARRGRPDAVFDHEPEPPPVQLRLGGCLGRFLLIMVFLFLVLISGLSVLGFSVLRLFLPY